MIHKTLIWPLIIVGVLILTGCNSGQMIRLKMVDSTNNQPLPEVSVLWKQCSSYNLITERQHHLIPTNVLSATDGTVIINGIRKGWINRFVFTKDGYVVCYGDYSSETPNSVDVSKRIMREPMPQDDFVLDKPITSVNPTNGYFVIKMTPVPPILK